MANTVDERIVEARFDSQQFEKGVDKTVKKLDELKEALNLDKAGKTISNIADETSKGIEKAGNTLQKLSDRLTTFKGMVKQQILGGLAQEVSNVFLTIERSVTGLVRSLSTQQIGAGLSKYSEILTSVRTMTAAGIAEDTAYEKIKRLAEYSDQTSYSLSQMTSGMSKLVAAGVDVDKAEKSMEGLANMCASAGVNIYDAQRAFYNFSQAMSTGSMATRDWISFENLNMATEGIKKVFMEAAVEVGTLKKTVDKNGNAIYKTSNKINKKVKANKDVTVTNLRDTLSYGWFDKETMIRATAISSYFEDLGKDMSKLTDEELEDFAAKAYQSAKEAKSFADVMGTLKDVIATGWATSFELIFGKLEKATEFFTWLTESHLAEAIYSIGEFRNAVLTAWGADFLDGGIFKKGGTGRDYILDGLQKIDELLGLIHEALATLFPTEFNSVLGRALTFPEIIGKRLGEMSFHFDKAATKIRDYFTELVQAKDDNGNLLYEEDGKTPVMERVLKSEYVERFGKIAEGIGSAFQIIGKGFSIASETIEKIFYKVQPIFDAIGDAVGKFLQPITDLNNNGDFFQNITESIDNLLNIIDPFIEPAAEFISFLGDVAAFFLEGSIGAITSSVEIFSDALGLLIELFGGTSAQKAEEGVGVIEGWRNKIHEFGEVCKEAFGSVKEFFTALFDDIRKIFGIGGDVEEGVEEGGLFQNVSKFFETNEFVQKVKDWIDQAIKDIGAWILDLPNKVKNLAINIGDFIHGLFYTKDENGKEVETPFKKFLNTIAESIGNWIKTLPSKISKIIGKVGNFAGKIWNYIDEFLFGKKTLKLKKVNGKNTYVTERLKSKFVEIVEQLWNSILDWIRTLPQKIGNLWNTVINAIFGEQKEGQSIPFVDWLRSIGDKISTAYNNILNWPVWAKIGDALGKVGEFVKEKFQIVYDFFFTPDEVTGETGFAQTLRTVSTWISDTYTNIKNWPVWTDIGKFLTDTGNWIKTSIFQPVYDFFFTPDEVTGETGFAQTLSTISTWISDTYTNIANWPVWTDIGKFLTDTGNWIKTSIFQPVYDFFFTPDEVTGETGFAQTLRTVSTWISDTYTNIKNWPVWTDIGKFLTDTGDWIKNSIFQPVYDFFFKKIEGQDGTEETGFSLWLTEAAHKIEAAYNEIAGWPIWQTIGQFLTDIWDWILGVFNGDEGSESFDASNSQAEEFENGMEQAAAEAEKAADAAKETAEKYGMEAAALELFGDGASTVTDAAEKAGKAAEGLSGLAKDPSFIVEGKPEFFGSGFNMFVSTAEAESEEAKDSAEKLKGASENVEAVVTAVNNFGDGASTVTDAAEKAGEAAEGLSGLAKDPSLIVEGKPEFFGSGFNMFVSTAEAESEEAKDSAEKLKGASENVEAVVTAANNYSNTTSEAVKDTGNTAKRNKTDSKTLSSAGTFFNGLIDSIGKIITDVTENLKDVKFDESITTLLTGLGTFLSGVFQAVGGVLVAVGKYLSEKQITDMKDVIGILKEIFGIFVQLYAGKTLVELGANAAKGVLNLFTRVGYTSIASDIEKLGIGLLAIVGAIVALKAFNIDESDLTKYGGWLIGILAALSILLTVISAIYKTRVLSNANSAPTSVAETVINKIGEAVTVIGAIAVAMALLPSVISAIADAKAKLKDAGADQKIGEDIMQTLIGLAGFIAAISVAGVVLGLIQKITVTGLDPVATAKTMASIAEVMVFAEVIIIAIGGLKTLTDKLTGEGVFDEGLEAIGQSIVELLSSLGEGIGGFIYAISHGGSSKADDEARTNQLAHEWMDYFVGLSETMPISDIERIVGLVERMIGIYERIKELGSKVTLLGQNVGALDIANTFGTLAKSMIEILTAFSLEGPASYEGELNSSGLTSNPYKLVNANNTVTPEGFSEGITQLYDYEKRTYSIWEEFSEGGSAYNAVERFIDLAGKIMETIGGVLGNSDFTNFVANTRQDNYETFFTRFSGLFSENGFFNSLITYIRNAYEMLEAADSADGLTKYSDAKFTNIIHTINSLFSIFTNLSPLTDVLTTEASYKQWYFNVRNMLDWGPSGNKNDFEDLIKRVSEAYKKIDKYSGELNKYKGSDTIQIINDLLGMFTVFSDTTGIGSDVWLDNYSAFHSKLTRSGFLDQYVNDIEQIYEAFKKSSLYDPDSGQIKNLFEFDGVNMVKNLFEALETGLSTGNLPEFDASAVGDAILKSIVKADDELAIAKAVHQMIQDGLLTFSKNGELGEYDLTGTSSEIQGVINQMQELTGGENGIDWSQMASSFGPDSELYQSITQGLGGAFDSAKDSATASISEITKSLSTMTLTTDSETGEQVDMITTLQDSLNSITEQISGMYTTGENAGKDLDAGLAAGIGAGQALIAAQTLANQISGSFTVTWDINSPSKVFEGFGRMLDLGLAKGIAEASSNPEDAATDVAENSISNIKTILEQIRDMSLEDMDIQVTITPVVDMSNVTQASGAIAAMGFGSAFGVQGVTGLNTLGMSVQGVDPRYNREPIAAKDYSEIIGSIRNQMSTLASEISSGVSGSFSGIQVVLDTGAIVGGIIDEIDSQLGRREFYASRS